MRYIASLDGGGTKLSCLIADERGKLAGRATAGSTNSQFDTVDEIRSAIRSGLTRALESAGIAASDLSAIYTAMPVLQAEIVERALDTLAGGNTAVHISDEFTLSLFGAIQERYGSLALAGTGSFAGVRNQDGFSAVGGWGAMIGDEGSGTYIGQQALAACSLMADGRGPSTVLLERILRLWNAPRLLDVMIMLYAAKLNAQRKLVASLCPLVGQCAAEGDQVAARILEDAAGQLADQMVHLIGKTSAQDLPLTVSGGVWKSSPLLFRSFGRRVKERYPDIALIPPKFDPVVGGILLGLEALGMDVRQLADASYDDFAFPILPLD
ncbi:N-acetylglucosamine kinase [Cohnella hashimotonis]|uniref:BadF/BadG/BcrA/BcrD ATPase family protein n=1 Tax=Cohnella hashimotonis TaxID=2826895 RepID=A0ABT6TME6_9BACL|nr:BadF/BadG/BcrA/BcrD ATPase family protein [Cohnella hashimotonis]MDI4648018.1 BadF/BadG/BcrA/BcrD ATPase family protein [Cohnella hashimotonis]